MSKTQTFSDLIPPGFEGVLDPAVMRYDEGDLVDLGRTKDGKRRRGIYKNRRLVIHDNAMISNGELVGGTVVGSISRDQMTPRRKRS